MLKLSALVGTLIAIMLLSMTLLVSMDKSIPNEMLIAFSSLVSFIVGLLTQTPKERESE